MIRPPVFSLPALSLPALSLAVALALATPIAAETWGCTVQEFRSTGHDKAFAAKNRSKGFRLTRQGNSITAEVTSKGFGRHTDRYRIIGRTRTDTVAMGEAEVSIETLTMPADPRGPLSRQGYFNASIALQSAIYVNAWLLRCTE